MVNAQLLTYNPPPLNSIFVTFPLQPFIYIMSSALLKLCNSIGKPTAFFIGNGPNLYTKTFPSWKELLVAAAANGKKFKPDGLTNTEVYDMVELHAPKNISVKKRVCDKLALKPSQPLDTHRRLMELAIKQDVPVLTTNFDEAFERSVEAGRFHINSQGFTHLYPWKTYYGFVKHQLPTDGFGIWKVHGDVRYPNSIRLGLTDYMGSAERARSLIHKGADRLFNDKRKNKWPGIQTWLQVWFSMPIIIVGFGYNTDEVFLRWLLIERRRYFNKLQLPMDVYYVTATAPDPAVTNLFNNIGVTIKQLKSFDAIYA